MLELAIKNLVNEVVSHEIGDGKVFPLFGTSALPFVTYTITPISEGPTKESQVELKIISDDYERTLKIRELIVGRFAMTPRSKSLVSNGIVMRSELAGGGALFNDAIQTWEESRIFIVIWRKKDVD